MKSFKDHMKSQIDLSQMRTAKQKEYEAIVDRWYKEKPLYHVLSKYPLKPFYNNSLQFYATPDIDVVAWTKRQHKSKEITLLPIDHQKIKIEQLVADLTAARGGPPMVHADWGSKDGRYTWGDDVALDYRTTRAGYTYVKYLSLDRHDI